MLFIRLENDEWWSSIIFEMFPVNKEKKNPIISPSNERFQSKKKFRVSVSECVNRIEN